MQAHVKVGDTHLTISERQRDSEDTTHSVLLFDSWDKVTEIVELEDESAAVTFLGEFLVMDGPGEGTLYRSLVKNPTFLP